MTSKALVIIGLAVLIAATGGVAIASNYNNQPTVADSASNTESVYDDTTADDDNTAYDDSDDLYTDDDGTVDKGEAVSTEPDDDPTSDVQPTDSEQYDENKTDGSDISLIAEYKINHVLNHNSGEPVAPQVAFGKYFRQCFLRLYDNGAFEMCINPSSDKIELGSYAISDDNLIVDYGNDRAASYKILYDDNNDIETIIVTSGQYIIYFS